MDQIRLISNTTLPTLTFILLAGTVLVSYGLARYYQHVQPFPFTDITHTGLYFPQYLLFRSAMIFLVPFIIISLRILEGYIINQKFTPPNWVIRICQVVFAIGFCLSTSTISSAGDMNWPLHVLGANLTFISVIVELLVLRHYTNKINSQRPGSIPYLYKLLFYLPHVIGVGLALQVPGNLIFRTKGMAIPQVMLTFYLAMILLAVGPGTAKQKLFVKLSQ